MAMSGKATRKGALLNSGTLSPNPWDLTLSGQNVWPKLEGTRTEDKPSQGCALSAASSAGCRGGSNVRVVPNSNQLRRTKLIAGKKWS
jgi:hypothetical protein